MDASPSHCNYRSKRCFNARTLKKNGALHRFCEFHRQQANDAQRRWQGRRRQTSHTSRPPAIDSGEESNANSRKLRRVDAFQNDALTTTSGFDTWVPIASKMTWAVEAACVPLAPFVPRPFAHDDLVLLEAFMSEGDDLPVDGMRWAPEVAFAQAFEEEGFRQGL